MNSDKFNTCVKKISENLNLNSDRVKKTIFQKYKNDSIFRITTQINIIKK